MPAMPGPRLVVIEPKLGLRRLERILDRPAMPLNRHQSFDPSSGWAPGREERELAIRDAAPDQKPARPQTGLPFGVRAGIEVGQLAIRPVVQPLAFRAVPRGEALPGALLEPCGDRLGGAGNGRLVAPGGEPIRGIRAQHIALASPSQPDLDLATPIHGVRGYPTERYAGRKRPLDHLQRKPRLGGEGGSGRDMSARHAGRVAGPGLWQVEGAVDEGMSVPGHIGREHPDLALGDLTSGARVLAPDPARGLALLQEARLVNDQHRIRIGQGLERIVTHEIAQRIGIPPASIEERLLAPGTRIPDPDPRRLPLASIRSCAAPARAGRRGTARPRRPCGPAGTRA